MTSLIDPTKPPQTHALTADVRANFATAKAEIEALQALDTGGPFLPLAGGSVDGSVTIGHDQSSYWTFNGGGGFAQATVNGIAQFLTSDYYQFADMSGSPMLQVASAGGTDNNLTIYSNAAGQDVLLRTPGSLQMQPGTGDIGGVKIVANPVYSGGQWYEMLGVSSQMSGTTSSQAGSLNAAHFVFSDSVDTSASAHNLLNYLAVDATFGGSNFKGYRNGITGSVSLTSALSSPGLNYVGIGGSAVAAASAGGTGLTRDTTGGGFWGANFYAFTTGNAQNIGAVVGIEVNPAISINTTCCNLVGIQVVPTSIHAVRGANHWDLGYSMVSQVGAVGIDIAYSIGDPGGQWPLRSDGSILRGRISNNNAVMPAAARHGIMLNEISFPAFGGGPRGGAFVSNAFAVDGLGAVQCGPAYLTPNAAGVALDVKGSVGTGSPTVASGGSGYTDNDILYDDYGGVYTAHVTGGAVTSVTVWTGTNGEVHQPWVSTHAPVTNPAPTKVWGFSPGAIGCTLNLTWDTSRSTLNVQPTGGTTIFGGSLQSTLPYQINWSSSGPSFAGFNFWDTTTSNGMCMFPDGPGIIAFGPSGNGGGATAAQVLINVTAASITASGGIHLGIVNSDPSSTLGGVEMYPGYGGLGVTAATLNYNFTGTHQFLNGTTPILHMDSTNGLTMQTPLKFATLPINAANDAGAASAGVAVGQTYRNGSALMVRAA